MTRRSPRQRIDPTESLGALLDRVAVDQGIARSILIESFEKAILDAARRAFGPSREIEAQFNDETGEIDLYQFLTVVETVRDPEREISREALQEQAGMEDTDLGDTLGFQIFWRPEDAGAAREHERVYGELVPPVREEHRALIHREIQDRRAEIS